MKSNRPPKPEAQKLRKPKQPRRQLQKPKQRLNVRRQRRRQSQRKNSQRLQPERRENLSLSTEEVDKPKIVKAKGSKNVHSGVAHVLATFNNTIVTITD